MPRRKVKEAGVAETGDGVLAWEALKRVEDYERAWKRYGAGGPAHALEPGPFPIRIQTEADLEAGRFELLAWEDPWRADGPASGFWRQDAMLEGLLEPGAEPLAAMVGDEGSIEGLRLLGGDLVLKVEHDGAAVQIRMRDVARFPEDGGIFIKYPFGLGLQQSVRRILDFWSVAARPAPRNGRGRWAEPGRWNG